jgi:hypothetical protein
MAAERQTIEHERKTEQPSWFTPKFSSGPTNPISPQASADFSATNLFNESKNVTKVDHDE